MIYDMVNLQIFYMKNDQQYCRRSLDIGNGTLMANILSSQDIFLRYDVLSDTHHNQPTL